MIGYTTIPETAIQLLRRTVNEEIGHLEYMHYHLIAGEWDEIADHFNIPSRITALREALARADGEGAV